MMLGPVSSENEGAGSGTGRVRAFSLVIRACWCWRGGVVSAARARGLPGGWPYLLQDVRVCLLEVVEGLEEASLDDGHVLLCEVGVVLGGAVWARPQQEASQSFVAHCCHSETQQLHCQQHLMHHGRYCHTNCVLLTLLTPCSFSECLFFFESFRSGHLALLHVPRLLCS